MTKIDISFKCVLTKKDYTIVRQENIITDKDNLIVGIYETKSFGFIVCCNRENITLDYTKFAATKKQAEKIYSEMIIEIKKDLER